MDYGPLHQGKNLQTDITGTASERPSSNQNQQRPARSDQVDLLGIDQFSANIQGESDPGH